MKVLHLEAGRHLYGGAVQVVELIAGLAAAGVRNLLVCPPGSAAAGRVGDCEVRTLAMRGDLDLSLPRRLTVMIDAWGPDLVHVHSRRGADLYGGRAARRAGRPAVVTRRVESPEPAAWLRFKYRPYAAVIAISSRIADRLTQHAGLDPARVHTVPSGVDTVRFRPHDEARAGIRAAFALPDGAPVAAMIAQMIPRKGHAVLFDALPALVQRHPQLHLLLFGQGPEEAALRRDVDRRGLASRVHFAGFRADLARLLSGVDVVVHPAHREGMGVALLEAMSAGVAVVACSAGGISEVIRDGSEGLLVPPNDSKALIAAMDRLLGDDTFRRTLGAAARQRIEQHFSTSAMTAGNLDVYGRVLDNRA